MELTLKAWNIAWSRLIQVTRTYRRLNRPKWFFWVGRCAELSLPYKMTARGEGGYNDSYFAPWETAN